MLVHYNFSLDEIFVAFLLCHSVPHPLARVPPSNITQSAKTVNRTPEECVFVELEFNMQCYLAKNTLLHTACSAILPVGYREQSV